MFDKTNPIFSPWVTITTNKKKEARLACIKYVLNTIAYKDNHEPYELDPTIVKKYLQIHENNENLE